MRLTLWLHIIGVALWIGPQVALAIAAVPALRSIADPSARREATRILTSRFNMLAWSAFALLIVTGLGNLGGSLAAPADLFSGPYGATLALKLALVFLVGLLSFAHSRFLGPRLLALLPDTPPEQSARLRRISVLASLGGLALSLAVVWLGVALHYSGGL